MCGRYIIKSKIKAIEKRFNIEVQEGIQHENNFNVAPGDNAPVITNDKPKELQQFRFGLQPFWSKNPMYLINARAEGDKNKENDPSYKGAKGIVEKPSFRKPIRSQRCLVIADAFIEGTTNERLDKPFVVYIWNKKNMPFALAGIWDTWVDKGTGEILNSFAIITTTANKLLQKLPHHRSPVIFQDREEEQLWLNTETPMAEVTELLRPYPSELMNAYPISNAIKNPRSKGIELMKPTGQRIVKEYNYEFEKYLELQGMGMTGSRRRKLEDEE